jgi:hypothetical protein
VLATPKGLVNPEGLWIGQMYSHGLEPPYTRHWIDYGHVKGISLVQTTYQIGLHMGAGCDLPHPFSGCAKNHTGFCYKPLDHVDKKLEFYTGHYFDEIVHKKDLIAINRTTGGVLFHVLINRMEKYTNNKTKLHVVNEYAANYFPQIKLALRARRLDLIVEAPFVWRPMRPIKRYEVGEF